MLPPEESEGLNLKLLQRNTLLINNMYCTVLWIQSVGVTLMYVRLDALCEL